MIAVRFVCGMTLFLPKNTSPFIGDERDRKFGHTIISGERTITGDGVAVGLGVALTTGPEVGAEVGVEVGTGAMHSLVRED